MYYSEQLNIGFLTPPRTGSRTIREVLLKNGFKRPFNVGHHQKCQETIDRMDRVYVSVRNHWDCLVSWWTGGVERGGKLARKANGFDEWLMGFYTHKVLAGGEDGMGAYIKPGRMFGQWLKHGTHLIRFEHLEDDLHSALPFDFDLPHVTDQNSSRGGRHYSEFYTPELAAWVGEIFHDEIEMLGYKFERGHNGL